MAEYNQLKKEKIIYRIGIVLLSVWFGASGYLEITKNPLVWERTLQMGYPAYFITSLGIAKIAGVIVLLIPNKPGWLKEWVFAAFFFDVIFAFISGYSFAGIAELVKPVIAFILILITYTMFRKINPALRVSFK
ncbi:DoxX family protein [Ferruginibacter sp. SUN106]|uniref:DoxX family protein n=1 Tax=Ferruginibacter sp. SUN106 TaxID=2978348 RepID=UPI003D3678F5